MTSSRDPRTCIEEMLAAIANIEADTEGLDFDRFAADRRARQLVERNVEIISEASRRLPQSARISEANIPWREIAGIGNVLRHDYGLVRPDILWGIRSDRLPDLKRALERMRERLRADDGANPQRPR